MKLAQSDRERFEAKVGPADPKTGCLEWLGRKDKDGYGQFDVNKNGKWGSQQAHRIAFILYAGPIPDGKIIVHLYCDNPPGVNPSHLRMASQAQNVMHMLRKGRSPSRVGENHPYSKLTESDVIAIRKQYAEGGITYENLGQQYGVSSGAIARVVRRENWKHIPE